VNRPRVGEIVGRFAAASNTTLLGRTAEGGLVVYKPVAGNRPLWDFDVSTLAVREVLAHRLAEAMGFTGLVPETVLGDGPMGPGALQRYVDEDPSYDPLPEIRRGDAGLWPVALLDLVANNADRKAGHLLREAGSGALRAVDHGLTFHPEPKLRTVLWAFAGERLPEPMIAAVQRLRGGLDPLLDEISGTLGPAEAAALSERVGVLAALPVHPEPPEDRPPIPWPPF
jgi:hypothetical protein